jgi:hypothetical protein
MNSRNKLLMLVIAFVVVLGLLLGMFLSFAPKKAEPVIEEQEVEEMIGEAEGDEENLQSVEEIQGDA